MSDIHDPPLVFIIKFFLVIACTYGAGKIFYTVTGSAFIGGAVSIAVLLGLAIWESDQMNERRRRRDQGR